MKRIVFFFLLFPSWLYAQELPLFDKQLPSIADREREGALKLTARSMVSAASNDYDVYHYRCEWQIDPAVSYIAGKITPAFTMTGNADSICFDCSNQLLVDSVWYHGNKISFLQQPGNILRIQLPAVIGSGTRDSVSIFYQGNPVATGFGSFYQGMHAGVPVIWTLSEPYGAKDWWPCKDGLVDKADSIDIFILHPSSYIASSNGIMTDEQVQGGNTITHFKHLFPIASYLVAISVTNFNIWQDTVSLNGKILNLQSYFYPESYASFVGAESFTKNALQIFTNSFGDFPFIKEKYGHTQFGWGGGMEHQTNSFIGTPNHSLIAHELTHQWFGDKITCKSWGDIWLNEGFATYGQALYTEINFPGFRLTGLKNLINNITSAPGGSVYVTDTTNVGRIFSGRLSYNKGFYVLYMLRWILGDSLFYKGLQKYLNDPKLAFGFATTADLQRNLEEISGKNFSSFFQKWIYGQGYPNYDASWSQNNNNWAKVRLNQTTSHSSVSFYEMPVQLQFMNASQTKSFVVDHRFSGQEFWLDVGFVADTVIIDPEFWILSRIKTSVKLTNTSSTPNELLIYPNPSPSNGNISLKNPTGKILSVQLFNSIGQLVFISQFPTPGRDELIPIPFSRFARGTYWLRLRNDKDLRLVKKILH